MKRFMLEYIFKSDYCYNSKDVHYKHIVVGHTKNYYLKKLKEMNARNIKIEELKDTKKVK